MSLTTKAREIPLNMAPMENKSAPMPSYTSIVQQEKVLSRDLAIVIDSVENHTLEDYAVELARIVNPKDILYVSRISQARICFYLRNKEIVQNLTKEDNKTTLKIGEHTLAIRTLVSKAKRIIVSNVQPCIPTSLIQQELNKLDIHPVSSITSIKAGIHRPELGHLMSFRKQLYINPEDLDKIPTNLKISHDNVNFWIYFSTEKLSCYLCHEEGHLAKYCKNSEINTTTNQESSPTRQFIENIDIDSTALASHTLQDTRASIFPPIPTSPALKRLRSPTASSSSSSTSPLPNINDGKESFIKPSLKKKKEKIEKPSNYSNHLLPAKEFVECKENNFPLSFDDLVAFLENTRGKTNITDIAKLFTTDLMQLSDMLTGIYNHLTNRSIKSKITRIRNVLSNNTLQYQFDSDSSFSDSKPL